MSGRIIWRRINNLKLLNGFFIQRKRLKCLNTNFNLKNTNYKGKLIFSGTFSLLSFLGLQDDEDDIEPNIILTIKRSIYAIKKREYKKAEQLLHIALNQAQTINHHKAITYIYDIMANLAFEIKDFDKAKNLFIVVMQRLISTGTPENDMKIIHISLKMAKLLEKTGDFETAEDGYRHCLTNIEKHLETNPNDEDASVLLAMTQEWYAKMLLAKSRLSEALEYYLKAYNLCSKIYGDAHEQTVVLLNNLGMVNCLLKNYDDALNYFSDAILIGKTLPETDLSFIHINMGNLYLKRSLYKEAKKCCALGLSLAKENNNDESKQQANSCLDEIKSSLGQK